MLKRIITGIVLGLVLIPLLVLGSWPFLLVGLFLTFVGGYEVLKMFSLKNKDLDFLKFLLPLTNAATLFVAYVSGLSQFLLFIICFFILLNILMAYLYCENKKLAGKQVIISYFYTGILLNSAILVRFMFATNLFSNIRESIFDTGFYMLVYGVIIATVTDMAAYFFGIKFGKHKMCPTISPKKSWEGAISGTIIGTVSGCGMYFLATNLLGFSGFAVISELLLGYQILIIFLISLALSILGQCGDLYASKLKRGYGIKDYGNIFPGHGGVMDRFDSLTFVGAFIFLMIVLLGA